MSAPTVKTIMTRLGYDRNKAKRLRGLMVGDVNPDDFASVQTWVSQCHNRPRRIERTMLAINELMGGFGVEVIDTENNQRPIYVDSFYRYFVAEYINMGDTYDATIVRDTRTGRFMITSWGDYVEAKRLF